ncbi:Protein SRG1 [Dichanthelium oligosanthes]|uniref:Protein SRG1 n=1 Tax=Dichanthelium oligosanthes TaxID=888268 RepID=A0A1E5VK21_9POAL|nr:Protein SRG1 [Dichanthelium oligosanthes]
MVDTSAKPANLGGSLPVPNVQDLASRPAADLTPHVLNRYLRGDDAPAVSTTTVAVDAAAAASSSSSVPVVDLARLLDPALADEEAARLRAACEDWGFFQVVNHGVPDQVIHDVKEDLKGFFRLPLQEKRALAQGPGGIEGYGQAFVVSQDQKLDWADMLFLSTQPPEYRSLNFWPSRPATFRGSLERYSEEVQRVATDLLRAMAKNLGVEDDPEKMTRIAAAQAMRINYYPPCPQAHDKVLGLSPHSDAVGLTLLLQVSPVAGLQIRREGAWIPVEPLPGALVANVGDVIEVLTNGRYKSIEHRAVVNARQERVSVAAFHSARFDGVYGPLEESIGGGEAPRYRTIGVEEYVKLVLSSKLEGKNIMDAMKITPAS